MAHAVTSTRLGDELNKKYFKGIYYRNDVGGAYANDNTMISLAYMLLSPKRLDRLNSKEAQFVVSEVNLRGLNDADIMACVDVANIENSSFSDDAFLGFSDGVAFVFYESDKSSEVKALIDKVDPAVKEYGWTHEQAIDNFINGAACVSAFLNKERNAAIIYASKAQMAKTIHRVAAMMPKVMAPCFAGDLALTPDELDAIRALSDGDMAKFSAFCDKFFAAKNFYKEEVMAAVSGFCSGRVSSDIEDLERSNRRAESEIDRLLESITSYRRQIDRANAKIIQLRYMKEDGPKMEAELSEFLLNNKAIKVVKRDGEALRILVKCYLDDYDEDIYKTHVINLRNGRWSYVYDEVRVDCPNEVARQVYEEIWSKHRFNLRVYSGWTVEQSGTVSSIRGFGSRGYKEADLTGYYPHPHIDSFGCYSGYKITLEQLGHKRDFVGILCTLTASSHSLNWADSTVVSNMMGNLWGSSFEKKYFEDKDGNEYSLSDIVTIVKKEMEEAAAQTEPAAPAAPTEQPAARRRRAAE